jgi:hypothetical protein
LGVDVKLLSGLSLMGVSRVDEPGFGGLWWWLMALMAYSVEAR